MIYPNLLNLLQEMAYDNGLSLKPNHEFVWPMNAPALEGLAAQLSKEEQAFLAAGEQTEVEKLVESRGLEPLHYFLNQAFDGDLHKNFYWR